ncbi:MAG: hypothetical protein H0W48_04605 [Methylibium sp.]|nr:hypothetical protein [Methylibium sp.]
MTDNLTAKTDVTSGTSTNYSFNIAPTSNRMPASAIWVSATALMPPATGPATAASPTPITTAVA